MQETDVAVIGGGIVGLCLARELAIAGIAVTLLDDGRHSGTTANAGSLHVQMQSRFLRLYPDLVPNLEASLPLYPAAAQRWASLASELGADIELRQSGGLMICEDATSYEFLARKCAREEQLGLRVAMLDRAEVRRIAPYLGDVVTGAELCFDEGKLNPLLANQAMWRDLRARGVPHRLEVRVERLERDGAAMRLTLHDGTTLRAGRVVLAAGAGTRSHLEVFHHAQIAKNATALGHIGNAELGNLVRGASRHGLAANLYAACARFDQAHDAFEQGAFAHTVAPHQTDGFGAGHGEVNAAQDVAGAVVGVNALGIDQQVAHACSSPR